MRCLLTIAVVLAAAACDAPLRFPDNISVKSDVVYCRGGGRDLRLDLYTPKVRAAVPAPGIILIHGGAWRVGFRRQFMRQAVHLASHVGYVAAAIEYRLSSEAAFPAAVEDSKCAVRWLRANAAALGVDPNRIAAAGGSAGAHLAAMLGVTDKAAGLEGNGGHPQFSSRVNAVVAFNGAFDLSTAVRSEATVAPTSQFLGGTLEQRRDVYERASPATYVSSDTPPFLFFHGTADTTVSVEQSRMMAKKIQDAGGRARIFETEGAPHGFFNGPPHYETTLDRMVAFLREHLERR
jgi:acetyl esterase/lipase